VSERGPRGARLVAIDERGDRQLVLVRAPEERARDTHPVISPDGTHLVFASSRDRPLDETSLWIAPLGEDAAPTRLTTGAGIESHPAWTPDGRAIVFASTRAGTFDLWKITLASGALERLTTADTHEITPTVARDGAIIYAAVNPRGDGSHLEVRAPDGTISRLTDGPADAAPALSPDGTMLAFSRPVVRGDAADAELFVMPRAGGEATRLVDLPLTDESGPVWSPDGNYVFATSVLRGEGGAVRFSSVIAIDRARPSARLLEDHGGALPRLTPAIARGPLDVRSLAADPEYLPELGRIMAHAIEEQQGR
jgi:dipeptidyl aminopeptidase/acylaminoacyl peptidase